MRRRRRAILRQRAARSRRREIPQVPILDSGTVFTLYVERHDPTPTGGEHPGGGGLAAS